MGTVIGWVEPKKASKDEKAEAPTPAKDEAKKAPAKTKKK